MRTLIRKPKAMFLRGFLCVALLLVAAATCHNPPHDNEYDPDNPNKASLSGTVYGPDDVIPGAIVHLIPDYDPTDVYTDTADANGEYLFEELDPGIYTISAKAEYYSTFECYPESLPADTEAVIDIYMHWFFTFDNESAGTIQPFGFNPVYGNWKVAEDPSAPSSPHVYRCETMDDGFAAFKDVLSNFSMGADFKIVAPDTMWHVGFRFRSINPDSFYYLSLSGGAMHLEKWVNGSMSVLGFSSISIHTDEWNYLYVDACGSNFTVYLNGEEKIEATDSTFTQGRVGLYVAKGANDSTTAHFDNVELCE